MPSPGVEKEKSLRTAGFNDAEIQAWKADTYKSLSDAGFSGKEADEYFGVADPDMSPVKNQISENLKAFGPPETLATPTSANSEALPGGAPIEIPAAPPTDGEKKEEPRKATTFLEAVEAGFDLSSTNLVKEYLKGNKKPIDFVLPEDAPMFYSIASKAATVLGDVPAMVAGGIGGSALGGAAAAPLAVVPGIGQAVTAAGALVGSGAGAMALPAAIRSTLMQHYEKGDIQDFGDFWERASAVFIDTMKEGAIGAATMGAGKGVGAALEGVAGPAVKTTAQLTSEVATMVTVGRALEGQAPNAQDFIEGAVLVAGFHGSVKAGAKMREIYKRTGIRPEQVAEQAKTDPTVLQDMLVEGNQIPKAYEPFAENVKPPAAPKEPNPQPKSAPRSEAVEKILSQVGEKTAKESKPYSVAEAYKDFVDQLDPIKRAEKQLSAGKDLDAADSGYKLARMANDSPAKVKHMMEKGMLDFESLKVTGKPYQEIIAPIRDDLAGFDAYRLSKRALEVEGRGIKSGFDLEAAKKVVEEGASKFEKAHLESVEFNNGIYKYARDSGILSNEIYESSLDRGKAYVSLKRILEEEGGGAGSGKGGLPSSLKKLKGSESKVQSPTISMLENMEAVVQFAEKNRAVDTFIRQAEKQPELGLVQKAEGSKIPKKNEIAVYRNGERLVYETEPAIAEAIKGLDGDGAATNVFFKIARGITVAKKIGISMTPDFVARNAFRDQLTKGVFSKSGSAPFTDIVSAMGDLIKKNDTYYNWLKSGGANGAFLDIGTSYLEKEIFKLSKETGLVEKAWNVPKKAVDYVKIAGMLVENSVRLAEFKRVTKGASEGKVLFEGGYASREITVDFQRVGAKLSALNSITAFLNVSVQGLDRTSRALKEDPKGVALRAATYITTPSVLLWYANKDDERYKEIPRWQKDLFWIIPIDKWEKATDPDAANGLPAHSVRTGKDGSIEINTGPIIRLPKPQELGLIFGSVPERVLESFFTDNPKALKDFEETIGSAITPSVVPDILSAPMEQYFNKSLFTGAKLMPGHLEGVAPEYQYTEYTSEMAKALGKFVSFVPGTGSPNSVASPVVIENYVRAWTGTLGMYALQVSDQFLTKTGLVPDPVKPASTLADIPFVKAFVVRYPSAGAQSIQDFYDRFEEVSPDIKALDLLVKSGDMLEYEKLANLEETQAKMTEIGGLEGIKDSLTNQSKFIRNIYKNPELSRDEKRQIIDGIYYQMIETAKMGNELTEELKRSLRANTVAK